MTRFRKQTNIRTAKAKTTYGKSKFITLNSKDGQVNEDNPVLPKKNKRRRPR